MPMPSTPLIKSFSRGVKIVQPGDVPQFVLHDGQQVDPIHGPRVHGLQLLLAAEEAVNSSSDAGVGSTNQP